MRAEALIKQYDWQELPGKFIKTGRYLFLKGGYHSVDKGGPDWGSNRDEDTYYIGDTAGFVTLTADGGEYSVPLVFGYTLWFKQHFRGNKAPFFGEDANPQLAALLANAQHLVGWEEPEEELFLCIDMPCLPAGAKEVAIAVTPSPKKKGTPVFTGFAQSALLPEGFSGKAAVCGETPTNVQKALFAINLEMLTFEEDFTAHPVMAKEEGSVVFSGTPLANAASFVFAENNRDIAGKTEENGMVHESSLGAPSWRYDGFGTWCPGANSYYTDFWSRNHHSVTSLYRFGEKAKARAAVAFSNEHMLFFNREKKTLGGKVLYGHWPAVLNNPLFYSEILAPHAGWYTKYTKERFGEEYQNLGNFEVDAHGCAMLAVYNVWRFEGANPAWVEENWEAVCQPVCFLEWCLENPGLSFSEHGLLYGETEAALCDINLGAGMQITMYGNIACALGAECYAAMAEAAGKTEEATRWKKLADGLAHAITQYFGQGGKWDLSKKGFYHDITLGILSDVFGYDLANDLPKAWQAWRTLSQNTYTEDIEGYVAPSFVGPRGIGYDHSFIWQQAMLLDNVAHYSRLGENLIKISYAPRLPKPYIVPECSSYSAEKGCYRRHGDLGNLAHQAEAVHAMYMMLGWNPAKNGKLKWVPRLPLSWQAKANGFSVPGLNAEIGFYWAHPQNGIQCACVHINDGTEANELVFRAGPFAGSQNLRAVVNGKETAVLPEIREGYTWGLLSCPLVKGENRIEVSAE